MEFTDNKKHPHLLLKMAVLYLEYGSFRATLSLCTLIIECYLQFPLMSEAIFLSAVTAKELNKHLESAQYFQFLVDRPPFRLRSYVILLLAAMEYEKSEEYRDHAREAYTQAYKLMVTINPTTTSERNAQHVYKTSRKNENYRVHMWYTDDDTWFDLARRMMELNHPTLAKAALEVARRRSATLTVEMLLIEAAARWRTNDLEGVKSSIMELLSLEYCNFSARYILANISDDWRSQFLLEDRCARRIQICFRSVLLRRNWRYTAVSSASCA
jgi:hypothetical protein